MSCSSWYICIIMKNIDLMFFILRPLLFWRPFTLRPPWSFILVDMTPQKLRLIVIHRCKLQFDIYPPAHKFYSGIYLIKREQFRSCFHQSKSDMLLNFDDNSIFEYLKVQSVSMKIEAVAQIDRCTYVKSCTWLHKTNFLLWGQSF